MNINRRNFITTAVLTIPTLTMGISLKPNIPEIIDANYIWNVIIPKLPKRDYYCMIYKSNGEFYNSNFEVKTEIHDHVEVLACKQDLNIIENRNSFLYWKSIHYTSPENSLENIIYNIHFKKEYMNDYIKRMKLSKFECDSTLCRANSLLEDLV